jgi:arabinoxylan arabinofuranohydrolase
VTRKYYLYTFFGANYKTDGKEGPAPGSPNYVAGFGEQGPKTVVAESDSPAGPFVNPVMCDWPPANAIGAFDPSALVDPQLDGSVRAYAFWGMRGGDRSAEIDPTDMHTIIDPKTRKPDRNAWHKTLRDEAENNGSTLFEASSIRKVAEGKYVYIYSANEKWSALTYCYANDPAGPWTYGGQIVDDSIGWNGGNGHGGITEINGKWYVFYHRATSNDYNRQAMAEPIDLRIEGDKVVIPHVEMTSEGVETGGLDAFRRYNAGVICYHNNDVRIAGVERNPDGLNPLVGIDKPGTVVGFKYFNFGAAKVTDADKLKLKLNVRRLADALVSILVAPPQDADEPAKRVEIAKFNLQDQVSADGKFDEAAISLSGLDGNAALQALGGLKGKLAVYLSFDGSGEMCQLKEIEFAKGDAPTPNPLRDVGLSPDTIQNGKVTALPIKGRPGDSIKLSVFPESGYALKSIKVVDAEGREIRLNPNGAAPYAPKSFNFEMPDSAVRVLAEFGR